MAKNIIEESYTPAATTKMPYVILKPEEYSAKAGDEYVKYTPQVGKTNSFSKLVKYLVIIWCLAAAFILIQQTVGTNMILVEFRDRVIHKIIVSFSPGTDRPETPMPPICIPGLPYRPDNCNTCFCDDEGQPGACTKMLCPNDGNDIVMEI